MRAISSTVMAVLVIAALFWGNCLSCPQVLESLLKTPSPHSCCPHPKQDSKTCENGAVRHFMKADPGGNPALATAAVVHVQPVAAPAVVAGPAITPVLEPASNPPPDLLSLYGTFRI